jgi:Na+/melibiose symporter-like transporter
MFAVLGNRQFRYLFSAQVIALTGTGLLTVALGLQAYDLAGADAGAVLGTALAIKMLAYVVVAPVISAATYRVSKRVLLVGSDAVRAGIAVMLPFVGQVWQIYALVFVLQAASATFTPTFQSVLPAVLAAEGDYTRGLSLSRLAYDLETLLSPALAAILLSVMTYHHLFVGTVVGFLLSACLVLKTVLPQTDSNRSTETFRQRTTAGARIMMSRPVLRSLLALNVAVAAATALVVVNTVVYVHDILGGGSSSVPVLLACYGGGSMAAALLAPVLLRVVTDRRLMLSGGAVLTAGLGAAAGLLAGPVALWPAFCAVWVALGAGTSLIATPVGRLLRYETELNHRAAVFAAQFSLSHAGFFLTYPLAGWLGVLAGQPVAAAVLALLALAAAGLAARTWPVAEAAVGGARTREAVA